MWTARTSFFLSVGILTIYRQLGFWSLLSVSSPSIIAKIFENCLSCILLFSILHYASAVTQDVYESHRANRLGALKVPTHHGLLPGNLGFLLYTAKRNATEQPGETFEEMHKKYGALFGVRILGTFLVSTLDPSHMQRILAVNFENYGKSVDFLNCFRDILGEGVFNSDQKGLWKWHRTLTRPHFAREEVFNYSHFLPYADRLISHLIQKSQTNSPVNVQEVFASFTSDSGTALFFGKDFGLNRFDGDAESGKAGKEFWDAFMGAQAHGLTRLERGGALWRFFELFGLYNPNEKNMKVIRKTLDSVIENALNSPRDKNNSKEKTLLMHLISETQDVKLIRDELLNILIAARDTTASILTSITYELARNPNVLKRLRAEIIEAVGDDPAHVPTYDEMKDCRYTRAVIHETLRVWPPVFMNYRFAWDEDVWTLNGTRYYIPANTTCRFPIGTMQKQEATWGPDAAQWIPERWLDDRIKFMTNQPFIFQAFSAGPRICLGQKFALNETTFAIARMMQRISSISLALDVQPPNTILRTGEISKYNGLTMSYRGGLWVRFGTDTD